MEKKKSTTGNEPQINLPSNVPILYTDSVLITSNQYGVVLNIAQSMGPTNQQNVVTRVGMSREHAKELLDALGKHLAMTMQGKAKQ